MPYNGSLLKKGTCKFQIWIVTPPQAPWKIFTLFTSNHNNLQCISTFIKCPTLNIKFIITFVKFWALEPLKMHSTKRKTWIIHKYTLILNTITMDRNPTLIIQNNHLITSQHHELSCLNNIFVTFQNLFLNMLVKSLNQPCQSNVYWDFFST